MVRINIRERGFSLVVVLLLMVLLSGIAVGLLFLSNTEVRIGSNDREDNIAYYGAESGMEKLTSDLASLYQTSISPTPAAIRNLTNFPPNQIPGVNYTETITWQPDASGNPASSWNTISSGSNHGLVAEIVPLTLQVSATRVSDASVNMMRNVEVALIPVFQFGVFSDTDLSYFPGPNFNFKGRVHTNGNLYLASGANLALFSKVSAFGEVVRDELANGWPTSNGYGGNIYIPNADGGCDTAQPDTNCLSFTVPDASWSGGIPTGSGAGNGGWIGTSQGTFKGFIANHDTGVTKLTLPFVGKNVGPVEIIRKPKDAGTTTLNSSRLYNKAQVRVLLADTQADLHPERGPIGDGEDVNLSNHAAINVTGAGNTAVAVANTAADPAWVAPLNCPDCANAGGATTWPLVNGWLRVEYVDAAGNWHGITNEWLRLGFARNVNVPTTPVGGANPNAVNPNAILILQEVADRNGDGAGDAPGALGTTTNWYPINLYDPREGEPRDTASAGSTCRTNGIMNAVEIDVGNLRKWFKGTIAGSGNQVDYLNQNGYVLYFSDRRGMQPDPNATPVANVTTGESGLEDVVNSVTGLPDGVLEAGANGSPEDVDGNTLLDNWGGKNIGFGFQKNTATNPPNPYLQTDCLAVGRQNRVSGARHVLKLIDGSLGNLPTRLDNDKGGFTVASENPVYVQGDYNAGGGAAFGDPHAAAAVIADAVTLLSNQWSDLNSMRNPTALNNRPANSTYYRMAVAAGKNMTFPHIGGTNQDFGTDGGVHNFLRYIENWGGATLHYQGSLVSLYFSQYATGTFKCCTVVYSPPTRDYSFDNLFLNPTNLPPGTPMFQDVVNLSYRQDFTPN
jgi:Tfp pilus assembly protein PilX